jgi:glucose/arabinose dehydrogenase
MLQRVSIFCLASVSVWAQAPGIPTPVLSNTPYVFDTAEQHKIKVTVIARGIPKPFSLTFLPNGDMLVTERAGRLRRIHDGLLLPDPVAGLPEIRAGGSAGLLDIVPDPAFAQNSRVYFTYSKPGAEAGTTATVLARARWTGTALSNVEDLLVGATAARTSGSRIAFGKDGFIYMSTGAPFDDNAQSPASLYGKVLRLTMDGKPAPGNPFIGRDVVHRRPVSNLEREPVRRKQPVWRDSRHRAAGAGSVQREDGRVAARGFVDRPPSAYPGCAPRPGRFPLCDYR